jgi:hypothetical protein
MSAGVRESLSKAKSAADKAYDEWLEKVHEDTLQWNECGYSKVESHALSIESLKTFTTANWGKLVALGAAFGIPVAASDTGAFGTVFGLVKTLLPIF